MKEANSVEFLTCDGDLPTRGGQDRDIGGELTNDTIGLRGSLAYAP